MTNTDSNTNTEAATRLATTIDTHLAAYCEPNPERRAELVASVWSIDGQLIDPPFDGAGHEAIAAMAGVLLTHYANHSFRRTTEIDAHHAFARYGWELVDVNGSVAVAGTDIAEVDDDGRIVRIVGFFGDM